LILNELLGGDASGASVKWIDVLLLKEISYNYLFAVIGYSLIAAGIVDLFKMLRK
jgi:hypothetical protein